MWPDLVDVAGSVENYVRAFGQALLQVRGDVLGLGIALVSNDDVGGAKEHATSGRLDEAQVGVEESDDNASGLPRKISIIGGALAFYKLSNDRPRTWYRLQVRDEQ